VRKFALPEMCLLVILQLALRISGSLGPWKCPDIGGSQRAACNMSRCKGAKIATVMRVDAGSTMSSLSWRLTAPVLPVRSAARHHRAVASLPDESAAAERTEAKLLKCGIEKLGSADAALRTHLEQGWTWLIQSHARHS